MDNMAIYNALREVPQNAQKAIGGGRLKGMTDINPMWRIEALTRQFGACGIGWYYDIVKQWTENGTDGQVAAFCNILLYYRHEGEWSKGIPGTGGSMFIAQERNGLYVSDECYKMALTDAISVAAKALGTGANVYWSASGSKYDKQPEPPPAQKPAPLNLKALYDLAQSKGYDARSVQNLVRKKFDGITPHQMTPEQYQKMYEGYNGANHKAS